MTREEAKKLMPVIQAFAEGKGIEAKTGSGWISIENMSFAGNPNNNLCPEYLFSSINKAEEAILKVDKSRRVTILYK